MSYPSRSNDRVTATTLSPLRDAFGRPAGKLRISVTDRCNFRCLFCMPNEPVWLPHKEILTFEEITRLVKLLSTMGVSKVRITGGEPLLRQQIERLVRMISSIPGIEHLGLTTNGFLLGEKAEILRKNGLKSVTVSLHSLKADRFEEMVKARGTFEKVLNGIQKAKDAGLRVKTNCVILRDCNEDEILDFARLAYEGNVTVRFIEYMPFDGNKLWDMEKVVGEAEIIETIRTAYSLEELPHEYGSTAQVYRFGNGSRGEIGVIPSMTKPFCGDCDRIRLKADGKIVPCMFSPAEFDIRPLLRSGAPNEDLEAFIRESFLQKAPGVETLLKQNVMVRHIRPMHTLGG